MLKLLYNIILIPPLRYPDKWKPAFLAMQLGFVAGGFGLIGRDFLFYLTVQNWEPLVLSELFFASFIFLGFIRFFTIQKGRAIFKLLPYPFSMTLELLVVW